jgi:Zn-dependent M28 family amino/carboxypeptidase
VLALGAGSASTQRAEPRVPLAGIEAHLAAFQQIAARNGGNRAAGTAGYDESARYVAARMRAAGYRVRFQEFSFTVVGDRSPPTLRPLSVVSPWRYRANRDYATLRYSGSGRVEGEVVAVDLRVPSPAANASTSGCEVSDFARFPAGAVALLQRGACQFRQKVENAAAAGARAVIVFNEGNPGRDQLFSGTLGAPRVRIPTLAASTAVGDALRHGARDGRTGVTVSLSADIVTQRHRTRNVIADSRAGSRDDLVVVGAHLDSVEQGPGINDNGSGSALILALGEQFADLRPRNALRFVWWAAEEVGLLGSRHYVGRLSPVGRRNHALYLNFDMVASPNFGIFVYDGDGSGSRSRASARHPGSARIERVFTDYFAARGLAVRETGLGGRSDHAPFDRARIPVGGIFTGAAGSKSASEQAVFGGRAGRPYDPCYHSRCDTLSNTSSRALARVAQAAAHATRHFARDVSGLGTRTR